jgi:hypothetical protein
MAFAMALCISICVNLIKREFSHLNSPLAYFTILISWDFFAEMQIASIAESSLRTCFLEASIEDMLPTAYVDARKTKL